MADKTKDALEKEIKRLTKELSEHKNLLKEAVGVNKQILGGFIEGVEKKLDNAISALEEIEGDENQLVQERKKTLEIAEELTHKTEKVNISVGNLQKVMKSGVEKSTKLQTEIALAEGADREKLQQQLKEQLEQNKKVEKLIKEQKKPRESFAKILKKTSNNIGEQIAQQREIQKNFTAYAAGNRNLLQALKKDKTGKVQEAMVKEMALAMKKTTTHGLKSVKELEKMVRSNINIEKATEDASDVFYGIKSTMSEMKDGMLDALERSPIIGGMFTAEMREHWKSGFDEIKHVTEHHFKEIMKPVEILVAPLKGMIKIGMIVYKMLKNRKPTEIEKRTAYHQQRMEHAFSQMNKTLYKLFGVGKKQADIMEDAEKKKDREVESKKKNLFIGIGALIAGVAAGFMKQVHDAFKGIINPLLWLGKMMDKGVMRVAEWMSKSQVKILSFFGDTFKFLRGITTKITDALSRIGKFFTSGPIGKFMFRIGRVLGAAIQPLMIAWNFIKDWKTLAEQFSTMWQDGKFFGTVAANILDVILMIPEMIINGILSLMGSDFSVDFGKEAILEMISNMTNGLSDMIWSWFGTDKEPSTGGFGADFDPDSYPEPVKNVPDRTEQRNAVEREKVKHEVEKQKHEKMMHEKSTETLEKQTEVIDEGNNKMVQSVQIVNKRQDEVPDSGDDGGFFSWISHAFE
jgi:hypothetical protein